MIYYTDPRAALDELLERQEAGAREAVEELWRNAGLSMPKLSDVRNVAVLARQLVTARFEDMLFRELALSSGFIPSWWPYPEDKFVSCSALKRSYLHPRICLRKHKGRLHVQRKRLANLAQWEGTKLSDVLTAEGESLPVWHQRRQQEVMGVCQKVNAPAHPYPLFLSLFVAHGVLFDNFHEDDSASGRSDFARRVVEPAIEKIRNALGLSPIIVKLPWWPELSHYPSHDVRLTDVMKPEHISLLY